jgi:hypothetical protein
LTHTVFKPHLHSYEKDKTKYTGGSLAEINVILKNYTNGKNLNEKTPGYEVVARFVMDNIKSEM